MRPFPELIVPDEYKPAAKNLFTKLEQRLGSGKAAADFLLEVLPPFAEAKLGMPLPLALAKLALQSVVEQVYATPTETGKPVSTPSEPSPVPTVQDDFAGITKFRNSADCSKWPVTVTISNARIEGGNIAWDEKPGQREARKWNEKREKKAINGEAIILIPSTKEAGMFDFLGIGQTRKILANLKASHEGPGFFAPWQPTKGQKIGFCIATISRDKPFAKMQERSNVCWLTLP